jgi:hypothetical protein
MLLEVVWAEDSGLEEKGQIKVTVLKNGLEEKGQIKVTVLKNEVI